MFQTVLSNKDHMEYGMVTVPFPIPEDQYADITRMLEVLHVGSELSRDCMVESVEGDWPVLNVLAGRDVGRHPPKNRWHFSNKDSFTFHEFPSRHSNYISLFTILISIIVFDFSDVKLFQNKLQDFCD